FVQRLQDVMLIAVMFFFACVGWLLFRAPDMATVSAFVRGLGPVNTLQPFETVAFYVMPLLAFEAVQLWKRNLEPVALLPGFARLNIRAFVVCGLFFLAAATPQKFIYFNF